MAKSVVFTKLASELASPGADSYDNWPHQHGAQGRLRLCHSPRSPTPLGPEILGLVRLARATSAFTNLASHVVSPGADFHEHPPHRRGAPRRIRTQGPRGCLRQTQPDPLQRILRLGSFSVELRCRQGNAETNVVSTELVVARRGQPSDRPTNHATARPTARLNDRRTFRLTACQVTRPTYRPTTEMPR